MMAKLRKRLYTLVWTNRLHEYGRAGVWLTNVSRYAIALVRDMFAGGLMMRSMSLVYTTLLSVVPLLAFSFALVKGFGVHTELEPLLFRLLEPLGPQGAVLTQYVIDLVENVRGGVLGGISLAFFIYTAVSMVQKVEESFNYVWHVAERQSFAKRLVEYLVVLSIVPIAIAIALGMIASLKSNTVVQMLLGFELLGPIVVVTGQLAPYVLVTSVFTFLYMYVPNTQVRFSSALLGGIGAGFAWASISVIFATFVVFSTRTQLIYSGFAVAIFALIWLYANWLILLIGAQLAFYHQNPAYLRIGRREPRLSNSMRERLALNVMLLIGKAFRQGQRCETVRSLAQRMKLPSVTLTPVIEGLIEAKLLTTTEDEDLLPGREMTRISLQEILAVVRERGETGSYRDPKWEKTVVNLGEKLDASVAETIGDRSLAELLDDAETA